MMYGNRCAAGNRPPAHRPTDTAGLKCPPEIGPNAYAPVSTVSPNASETPRRPMPTPGKVAASTALPHPPSTSQNVPRNSAASFVIVPPSRVETRAGTALLSRPLRQCCNTHREVMRSNPPGSDQLGDSGRRERPPTHGVLLLVDRDSPHLHQPAEYLVVERLGLRHRHFHAAQPVPVPSEVDAEPG